MVNRLRNPVHFLLVACFLLTAVAAVLVVPRIDRSPGKLNSLTTAARQQAPTGPPPAGYVDQYCGLWSVYSFAKLEGLDPAFESMLQSQWVEGTGSSMLQLMQAAEVLGLTSEPVSGWTRGDLLLADRPVILHVNSEPSQERYQHWLLFLGAHRGMATVIDGPRGRVQVPLSELALAWDGHGLLLATPDTALTLTWPRWLAIAGLVLGIGLIWLLNERFLNTATSGGRRLRRAIREVALACFLLVASVGAALAVADPYAGARGVVDRARLGHLADFLPKIGFERMKALVADEDILILDARLTRDFEGGHIPGAVNVPAGFVTDPIEQMLRDLPRDQPIAVYCLSPYCGFDDAAAEELLNRGFTDIRIYAAGWRDWKARQ